MAYNNNNRISDFLVRLSEIPKYVKSVSDIGIDFGTIAKSNKKLMGKDDSRMDELYDVFIPKDVDEATIPYFNKKLKDRQKELHKLASFTEIEDILDKMCDELIDYDNYGKFCSVSVDALNIKDNIKDGIRDNFGRIYSLLGFGDGTTAWEKVREWNIEGYLAYETLFEYKSKKEIIKEINEINHSLRNLNENKSQNLELISLNESKIIRNKELVSLYEDAFRIKKEFVNESDKNAGNIESDEVPTRIIGFQELRPESLIPVEVKDGKKRRLIWKQVDPETRQIRYVSDNAVIFVSYNKIPGTSNRISYVERLMRSYFLMRKLEDSRIAWNIMNSQFRMKIIIPVGNKTTIKAKQALQVVTNKHKEELYIDENSGNVTINGDPLVRWGKNVVLPSRQGQTPEVSAMSYEGPDLSRMDAVEYFRENLRRDSKLPKNRFDRDGGGGQVLLFEAKGIPYDEQTFYKYKNRVRREFEQIIKKPLIIQCFLDYPELRIDPEFATKIGISYNDNFQFEEAKESEIIAEKIAYIQDMEKLTRSDGQTPIYSKKFLYVTKYKVMTEDEWELNEKMLKEELAEDAKSSDGGNDKEL